MQPWRTINGIDALTDYLKDAANKDKYIKAPGDRRGDKETWHHTAWDANTRGILDEISQRLYFEAKTYPFIVEDPINSAVEVGYDGFVIDGQVADVGSWGIEIKDCGYIGTVMPYKDLPREIRFVNKAMAEPLRERVMRGWWSTEVRVDEKDVPYFTDPCARMGSPPGALLMEMYSNWGEIIWEGAAGNVAAPVPTCKYGVEAIITSMAACRRTIEIEYPKEISQWVKIKNNAVIDGKTHVLFQDEGLKEIGEVVAIGDSILQAVKKLKKYAALISAPELCINLDSIPCAIEELQKAQDDHGMKFGADKLPSEDEVDAVLE